jgi:hypothetical protein
VKLFEFSALHKEIVSWIQMTNRILSVFIFFWIWVTSYRNVSCDKLPISSGIFPVNLHPSKILREPR